MKELLFPLCNFSRYLLNEFSDTHRTCISAFPFPHRDCTGITLIITQHKHVRNLFQLGFTDLQAKLLTRTSASTRIPAAASACFTSKA